MYITFTQFMRPSGRPKKISIDRPYIIGLGAAELTKSGYKLEAEMLTNGLVSFTVEPPWVDSDSYDGPIAMEV
jgi:hypothetical protein